MRRLLGYLMPFKGALVVIVCFVLLQSLLGLVGPYLLGRAIDTSIAEKNIRSLLSTALVMLITYVVSNGFNVIANWWMAGISQNALKNLRGDLFGHIQSLPMRFFDTNPAGGLMSRLTNDIDAINQTVSQNIISLIASVITMTGILVSMFVLNHWLALACLIVVPLMYWFSNFIAKYTRKGFRELQKDLGDLNAVAEETISGFKVIKAFRRNDSAIETFRQKNEADVQIGRLRQLLCDAPHAADRRAGKLLRHRARESRRMASPQGARERRYDRDLHQLRAEFHLAAAADIQPLQFDSGGACGRGACLRDHRHGAGDIGAVISRSQARGRQRSYERK